MLETTAFYWAPVAANVSCIDHSVQTWIHTFHAWIYTNFVKQLQDFRVNKSWQCSLHHTTPQHVHGPIPVTICALGFLTFTCSPQVFFPSPHSEALSSNPSGWLLRAATSMLLDISQKKHCKLTGREVSLHTVFGLPMLVSCLELAPPPPRGVSERRIWSLETGPFSQALPCHRCSTQPQRLGMHEECLVCLQVIHFYLILTVATTLANITV